VKCYQGGFDVAKEARATSRERLRNAYSSVNIQWMDRVCVASFGHLLW
jgi:hypothetical protein